MSNICYLLPALHARHDVECRSQLGSEKYIAHIEHIVLNLVPPAPQRSLVAEYFRLISNFLCPYDQWFSCVDIVAMFGLWHAEQLTSTKTPLLLMIGALPPQ